MLKVSNESVGLSPWADNARTAVSQPGTFIGWRRDQALLSARKAAKPNKGRMGGPADFTTPFAFGSHEQREVIRGGFFLSAPILTEDECASIVDSANKMPPPGSVKRARFRWRKAGTFGVGNLFISNAVPHMTWAIFDRLKALLLSQPVSLLPEHLTRLSLEWDTFSLAANSENSTTYQEIHTDESDSGLNLNDLCLNGSRVAVTIALEKGCSFGVALRPERYSYRRPRWVRGVILNHAHCALRDATESHADDGTVRTRSKTKVKLDSSTIFFSFPQRNFFVF